MTKPYTDEELEEVKVIFRSMPSYAGETIRSSDIPRFTNAKGWPLSDEEIQNGVEYWDKFHDGVVSLEDMIRVCRNIHDTAELTKDRIQACDKDGDGFISREEFENFFRNLVVHDPRLKVSSFENFIQAVDTSNDGLVSVEECGAWIEKCLNQNKHYWDSKLNFNS